MHGGQNQITNTLALIPVRPSRVDPPMSAAKIISIRLAIAYIFLTTCFSKVHGHGNNILVCCLTLLHMGYLRDAMEHFGIPAVISDHTG